MKILLASQSPRRKELLQKAGYSFETISINISEDFKKNLNLDDQIMELAERKARSAWNHLSITSPDTLIIGSDTVVLDLRLGQVLGKPQTKDEAYSHLKSLSGVQHEVKTGVAFISLKKTILKIDTTKVVFKILTEKQIQNYINTDEPYDKAGSYGIQGAASEFVEKIEGSYTNVVGLPIELVTQVLKDEFFINGPTKS